MGDEGLASFKDFHSKKNEEKEEKELTN